MVPAAFCMAGVGFGGGWMIAHFFRLMLGWRSYSLAFKFCLLYFYGTGAGAVLWPWLAALDAESLSGEEWRKVVLYAPCAVGVSAGIRQVLINRFLAD
jgi:hypothetical protein